MSAGPWRLLILDTDATDPKWLIATIAPGDVRPASEIGLDPADLTAWVAGRAGPRRPALIPLIRPSVWRIEEQPPEN